jgi:hypothetical protein
MNKKRSNVSYCVYFGLSKGEGQWPEVTELTPKEKKDPRIFSQFILDINEQGSPFSPKIIKSCKVLYDGVSYLPPFPDLSSGEGAVTDGSYGLYIDGTKLCGRLRPIIEFELSKEVDPQDFCRLVWGSTFVLSPQASQEPFYAEDWNGYTEVLSQERTSQWVRHLKTQGAYSGKVFTLSELQNGVNAHKLS